MSFHQALLANDEIIPGMSILMGGFIAIVWTYRFYRDLCLG